MKVKLEIEDVQIGLVVNPGDSVLLSFGRRLTDQEAEEAQERISELLPGVRVVVVPEASNMALIPGGGHEI